MEERSLICFKIVVMLFGDFPWKVVETTETVIGVLEEFKQS